MEIALYHKKKLTTNEQVRDIEKVGLAGLSLAPVVQGHPNPWLTLRIPDLHDPE